MSNSSDSDQTVQAVRLHFSRNIVCCYGKVRFLYCTREYPDCDAATVSAGFLNGITPLHVNDNYYH
uniref:Uncharacterized protein n=1 Tax=Escherichia coli TaxID=562 RepID=A0A291RB65_ECOLX|nr:hypothetical protein [Escherichia coli]